MKLFSFGPDIEEAEGGGLETQEEAYERARLAQRPQKKQKSDTPQADTQEEIDEKREKRREKKRKANAKKLAKKHAALGTTPNSSVSTGKVKGGDTKKKPDSSSSESEEEHAKVGPAAPAPKTYYDPFTKKRIVIGSGSAAAMGDKQSQAAEKQSTSTAVAAATNGKLDALSDARARASKRRKGAGKSGSADPSSSSSSESSEDEQENKPAAKPPAPKTYFDPFTKKRVVIGGSSTSASGKNTDTAQEKRAKTNGVHEMKQGAAGQTKEDNLKSNTKGVAKSRCSEAASSASSDDESEEDATAHAKPSKPSEPAAPAPPKSFYDPFSKTRITVGAVAVPAAAAAATAAAAGDKRASAARASIKPAASTSRRQQGAGNTSSSSSSDSSSSSEEEGGQEGEEEEGTTSKNQKNPGPTSAAPKSYYDPFSKKRISVISVGPGAGEDATAGAAPPIDFNAPLPKKRGGRARPDLASNTHAAAASLAPVELDEVVSSDMAVDAGEAKVGGSKSNSNSSSADRGAAGAARGAAGAAVPAGAGVPGGALKHIMFVGQLPYAVTAEAVAKHFEACAPRGSGEIKVRLLTDKDTGRPRGIAFVEMPDAESGGRALLLDHSVLGGRRIRVEPTAKGSGNATARQDAIKGLKQEHHAATRLRVEQALDAVFQEGRGDTGGSVIVRADVDEGVMDFLCTIPLALVQQAAAEAAELQVSSIRNRSAYLMGFLKSKVKQLSEDPAEDPAGQASAGDKTLTGDRRGGGGGGGGARGGGEGGRGGGEAAWKKDEERKEREEKEKRRREKEEREGRAAAVGAGSSGALPVAPVEKIDFFSSEPLKRKRGGKARPDLAQSPAVPSLKEAAGERCSTAAEASPAAAAQLKSAHGRKRQHTSAYVSSGSADAAPAAPAAASVLTTPLSALPKPSSAAAAPAAPPAAAGAKINFDIPLPRKRGGKGKRPE